MSSLLSELNTSLSMNSLMKWAELRKRETDALEPLTEWARKAGILLNQHRSITKLEMDTEIDYILALAVSLPAKDAFLDCLSKLCTSQELRLPQSWTLGPKYRSKFHIWSISTYVGTYVFTTVFHKIMSFFRKLRASLRLLQKLYEMNVPPKEKPHRPFKTAWAVYEDTTHHGSEADFRVLNTRLRNGVFQEMELYEEALPNIGLSSTNQTCNKVRLAAMVSSAIFTVGCFHTTHIHYCSISWHHLHLNY